MATWTTLFKSCVSLVPTNIASVSADFYILKKV